MNIPLNPNRFVHRVKSLSNVLRDLEDVFPERDLTNQQEADLHDLIEGCRNILNELDKITDKYRILDTDPTSLSRKSQRLWKRLKWEPDDVQELRSRITSNVALLNAFNGRLTR